MRLFEALTFCYHVNRIIAETNEAANAQELQALRKLAKRESDIQQSAKISSIFVDPSITYRTRFGYVKAKLFERIPQADVQSIVNNLTQLPTHILEYKWRHYEKLSQRIKLNLRQLFLTLPFKDRDNQGKLFKAITFLKTALPTKKALNRFPTPEIPTAFIPKRLKPYLYDVETIIINHKKVTTKKLNVNKYEFLLYQCIVEQMDVFKITIENSVQFTTLEDELFSYTTWQHNKEYLLKALGLARLKKSAEETLREYEAILEKLFIETIDAIRLGKNKQFKRKAGQRRWSLPYEKVEKEENHPFFSKLTKMHILEILQITNVHIDYMRVFKHRLHRHLKKPKDTEAIMLALLARANNLGKSKMSESCDFTYDDLNDVDAAYIYKKNLIKGCNKIIRAITKLPMYKHFKIRDNLVYSSSDGTKIETHFCTTRSRYSSKYFGFGRGICAYRRNADNIPTNAFIIGANMAEHSYVYNITFNHQTDVHSDFHATDSAGGNKVNYVFFYFKNTELAIRYRDIYNTTTTRLAGFKPLCDYKGNIIKPVHQIRKSLIKKHWDFIQYYSYSVITKEISQHNLIHKLNKTEMKTEALEALWEFNRIFESIHILRTINDTQYRQAIQKCLNRGEASNKLYRNIRSYHGGKLRVRSNLEQDINHLCTHFVELIITYMNTFFLSTYLMQKEKEEDTEAIAYVKTISPIAWSYLIFHGHFSFKKNIAKTVFNTLLKALKKIRPN